MGVLRGKKGGKGKESKRKEMVGSYGFGSWRAKRGEKERKGRGGGE